VIDVSMYMHVTDPTSDVSMYMHHMTDHILVGPTIKNLIRQEQTHERSKTMVL